MVKTHVIRLWNARDQIAFCAFRSFSEEAQPNAGYTYMRRMRNNNLEIRIAGSSCCLQKFSF